MMYLICNEYLYILEYFHVWFAILKKRLHGESSIIIDWFKLWVFSCAVRILIFVKLKFGENDFLTAMLNMIDNLAALK